MVSFASLFVGLVFGIVNVELVAARGVDRVELLLDGRPAMELREPWRGPLDLGCTPAPHELVAVAYGPGGREVGRARQWVNRPRPPAEASLVVERESGRGPYVARLTWRALAGEVPRSVVVTLDERQIPVPDPVRFELPPSDPRRSHTLRATLDFGEDILATAEVHFGGSKRAEAFQEMTAIAVEMAKGSELPPPEGLAGWLERDGVPLEVAAVEEDGPTDVVFVCEGSALGPLRRAVLAGGRVVAGADVPEDLGFRFLFPSGQMKPQSTMVANTYPITSRFTTETGSLAWQAAVRVVWPAWSRKGQRLADAVAVAALSAAEQERRRAVVLLLGPQAEDGSLISPEEAASFLADLNVPFFVWSVGLKTSPEARRWPDHATVAGSRGFRSAVRDLVRGLERQRIVWVEGSHPPQSVIPAALATGIRRAGSASRP